MDGRRISKRLAYVLRHRPDSIGLRLEAGGWADVEELLEALRTHGRALTRAQLDDVVAASDKQRFAFDADGRRIRASQGHSVPVDLQLEATTPPPALFHGTVAAALDGITAHGLVPRGRHHVHLSVDVATARAVGQRRGRAVVLVVDAAAMAVIGTTFYRSANGVWLVAAVPAAYLSYTDGRRLSLGLTP